jgi:hypothetical protein
MKKQSLPKHIMQLTALLMLTTGILFYSGCSKDDDESQPVPTCSDGIQNQGETGVDCGGPCSACPTNICTGNSSSDYLPLANGNYWKVEDGINPNDYETYTVNGTATYNSTVYNKVEAADLSGSFFIYLRKASNGDIFYYNTSNNTEYLYLPASPTVNQQWALPVVIGIGTRKVISTTFSLTTSHCTYSNCLQIQDYDGNGNPNTTWYYKKGVGLVCETTFLPYKLSQLTLH